MTTIDIQALEVRNHLGEVLEQAHYQATQFRIKRKNKTMARLVGEPFMKALGQFVDHIMEHEPALADTLALMLDKELKGDIEQSRQEAKEGKLIPIEKVLD